MWYNLMTVECHLSDFIVTGSIWFVHLKLVKSAMYGIWNALEIHQYD